MVRPLDTDLEMNCILRLYPAGLTAWLFYLKHLMKLKVKVAQLCPTLCDPMDCTAYGILQAEILE